VLALLAACGLSGMLSRIASEKPRRAVALVLCVAVLAVPCRSSVSLALRYLKPTSIDLAAGFIEAGFPGHALVATGLPRFVLSQERFEVRSWAPLHACPPAVLRQYDLVVAPREELSAFGFRLLREFDDGSGALGVAAPERPSLERVEPSAAAASHDPDHSLGPWLGASSWRSPGGSAWISGEWPAARRIERVEVVSDDAGGMRPHALELEGRSDADPAWTKLEVWPLRPGRLARQSADSPPGQIYVLAPPVPLVGLRLSSQGGGAWGLARIVVLAEAER